MTSPEERVLRSSGGGSPELSPPPDDDDEIPEGFDDIARAFSQVSMFADNLLEDINDDSLRAKERRTERKRESTKRTNILVTPPSHNYVTDSDDDMKDDNSHTRLAVDHGRGYRPPVFDDDNSANLQSVGNDSDVSSLDLTWGGDGDESVDGSLVQDCQNLKSVTRSMQKEMQKQEEAFHANVTSDNGKSFFQKLEDAKAAEDAKAMMKTPKVRNGLARQSLLRDAPKTISIRNNSSVPILMSSSPKPKHAALLDQLHQFCEHLLGESPHLQLLAATLVLWLIFFKLVLAARGDLIDGEGRLRMGLTS